jgi:hypothetical protein
MSVLTWQECCPKLTKTLCDLSMKFHMFNQQQLLLYMSFDVCVWFAVDTRNWWKCNMIFCLLREILRIVWKLIVPCEDLSKTVCLLLTLQSIPKTYFLFFIMQNHKLFSNWKFLILTNINKSEKKIRKYFMNIWKFG